MGKTITYPLLAHDLPLSEQNLKNRTLCMGHLIAKSDPLRNPNGKSLDDEDSSICYSIQSGDKVKMLFAAVSLHNRPPVSQT